MKDSGLSELKFAALEEGEGVKCRVQIVQYSVYSRRQRHGNLTASLNVPWIAKGSTETTEFMSFELISNYVFYGIPPTIFKVPVQDSIIQI